MKSSIIISSLALALPAFAAPVTTSATPIATPQNQCQVDYNNCLAIGTPEVMCSCDMTACLGEDAARIREWCASKTSGLTSGTATATATATPSATASGCVAKDNACRASDPVTGLSANQAQCSADNAACQGTCYDAYNTCRTSRPNGLSANMAQCASEYAGCLGQNPFSEDGSLTIKPSIVARAFATPAPSNCVTKDNACRASDPVTGLSANQAFCSSEDAACKGACEESYNACRVAPDANMSYCASLYAGCLGTNPFEKRAAPTSAFAGLAIRSGSGIQYASVNAAGSQFWLQKDTATYCPEISGLVCPNTTTTQFLGGENTLALDTTVPGGQQVYVAADGRLSFTVAHSASTGEGASVTGFSIAQEGQHVQFNGDDFLACPVDDAYAVFAAAAVKDAAEDCVGFAFRVAESSAPAAWQYS
ncbi:hypothetical protein E4T42_01658 [Aureobasidium subglaciale]|nr:hypothetical protein E4T42_01658 [Aureobasidium subglaciale]